MLWVLVWVVLLLAGAAVIGWLGYRVFRKALDLLGEVGRAGDQLAEVAEQARRATEDRARREAAQPASARNSPDMTPLSEGVPRMAVPASERL